MSKPETVTFVARKPAVKIVTDSSARLPLDWANEHGVIVVPQTIAFKDHTFREDIDITPAELAQRAAQPDGTFSVTAPGINAFSDIYNTLADNKSDVISIHISSAMSATYKAAFTAKDEVSSRCVIHVIDSRTMGMGLHMLVRQAVLFAEQGLPTDQIVKRLRGHMQNIYGIFVSEDMPFLEHSKRLRPAQAYLGKMLNIVPCLTIEEGNLVAVEKVRSADRAIEKLSEFASEFEPNAEFALMQLATEHTPRSRELLESLKLALPKTKEFPCMPCGADIGHIIGAKGLGVMIFERIFNAQFPGVSQTHKSV